MNLGEALRAIADALDPVGGLDAHPWRMTTVVAGTNDVAAVALDRAEDLEYQHAMSGGLTRIAFEIELNVQASDDAAAYGRMLELLSAGAGEDRSVIDAVDAARRADRALDPPGPLAGLVIVDGTTPVFTEPTTGTPRLLVTVLRGWLPLPRT